MKDELEGIRNETVVGRRLINAHTSICLKRLRK
jgi:hypothetical protein